MESVIYSMFSQQQKIHPHLESEEDLSGCITDVLTKFQSISG